MAIVSGRLVFDRNRSAAIDAGDTGLSNVPIVLQDTNTLKRLTVLTDVNGNYSFGTVPDGNYRIVEAYGVTGGVPTPGDFSVATLGTVPVGEDPPISLVTNPTVGATNLDSISPNTLFITVSGADVTGQNFLDGPVEYIPISEIMDLGVTISATNLITAADGGTFGTFPAGTSANTGPVTVPYPGVTPGFIYKMAGTHEPVDGAYTVQNMMTNVVFITRGQWWSVTDHTMGDETGRFMAIDGANTGGLIFTQTVPVTPNSNYLFSSWILNLFKMTGYADPALGVKVWDQNGNILYDQTLGNTIPVNTQQPEWKEIGTMINSQNNTELKIAFVNQGPAELRGNSFAVDDIGFRGAQIPTFSPIKMVDRAMANVGETVTYTVSLTDTSTSTITNVKFQDTMPPGLVFQPQSVWINGISTTTANPEIGFYVPDISGGATATITFIARVDSVPSINPTNNIATMEYSYTPIQGGIPIHYRQLSNRVHLQVNQISDLADLTIVKISTKNPVQVRGKAMYSLVISNKGPSNAVNVVLQDAMPVELEQPEYSLDGGINWLAWAGSLSLGTLATGSITSVLMRGTVSPGSTCFINTATITSTTPDPDLSNNASTTRTAVDIRGCWNRRICPN